MNIFCPSPAQLPLSLSDLGFAVINTNYALQNGLNSSDALASETADRSVTTPA